MNIIFFKRPKPRQFNYKPLYYDPEKEEAENRKKAISSDDPRERMRAEIRRRWHADRKSASGGLNMVRVFIYIAFAAFALYLIFFTDFINNLVSVFLR
jgi:hypothetical protein